MPPSRAGQSFRIVALDQLPVLREATGRHDHGPVTKRLAVHFHTGDALSLED
jgi:hypothetical protein